MSLSDEKIFEAEVRRVANALWPSKIHGTAVILSGLERDGLFETEECIHLLECTVSRSKRKATEDTRKLDSGAALLRKQQPDKGIKTWFVTKFEPEADQVKEVRKSTSGVTPISFASFQAKLIDVRLYLHCRQQNRFGSIDNPLVGGASEDIKYIELSIREDACTELWKVPKISNSLVAGERFTMLGDYGIGKSMTLREVFRYMRKRYLAGQQSCFPLHINLREHHGQNNPAEIIARHADAVGYPNPSDLVRAWRAGYAIPILDGFDEVASSGLHGDWKRLREARWQTLSGVRKFIDDTPKNIGIVIAGRNSFFDTASERHEAIGDREFHQLLLHEFTEDQIRKYFEQIGYSGEIPTWLPSRPLLLSTLFYIGGRQVDGIENKFPDDPSVGWEALVDAIARREAKIEANVSGETIRRVLEILATKARATISGVGPLSRSDVTLAYTAVTGVHPSSESLAVLQRLPGLGTVPGSEDGHRIFLDEDLVDVLGVQDVYSAISNPYALEDRADVLVVDKTLAGIGGRVLGRKLEDTGFDVKRVREISQEFGRRKISRGVLGDLLVYSFEKGFQGGGNTLVKTIEFAELRLHKESGNLDMVRFDTCIFHTLQIDREFVRTSLPHFVDCSIHHLEGYLSASDIPQDRFEGCTFEFFIDIPISNAEIIRSDLPIKVRVLVTILKKLFVQSLSGRQLGALRRGLDVPEQRYVDEILDELLRRNLITRYSADSGWIVLPVRRQRGRVLAIISSPIGSNDELVKVFLE